MLYLRSRIAIDCCCISGWTMCILVTPSTGSRMGVVDAVAVHRGPGVRTVQEILHLRYLLGGRCRIAVERYSYNQCSSGGVPLQPAHSSAHRAIRDNLARPGIDAHAVCNISSSDPSRYVRSVPSPPAPAILASRVLRSCGVSTRMPAWCLRTRSRGVRSRHGRYTRHDGEERTAAYGGTPGALIPG